MSVSRHGRPCPGHPRGSATNLSAAQTSVNSVAYDEAAGFSWAAGLVPRLSGSSWAQAELELRRVEWRGRRRFSEPCGDLFCASDWRARVERARGSQDRLS